MLRSKAGQAMPPYGRDRTQPQIFLVSASRGWYYGCPGDSQPDSEVLGHSLALREVWYAEFMLSHCCGQFSCHILPFLAIDVLRRCLPPGQPRLMVAAHRPSLRR